jgi:hypothetical protein
MALPSPRPVLADVYFQYEAEGRTPQQPSIGGIVALAATNDWGPVNTAVLCLSEDEYLGGNDANPGGFGSSDTALHRAVHDAFKGQQVNGKAGAGAVLVYRQATPSAAAASHILQNTTPATGVTITAKNPGTRGNALRLTVQASATVGNKTLLILDGALVIESYDFVQTNISGLVAEVNLASQWVTATLGVDGVALANVSAVALTGGNDGTVLTGTEWTATMNAFDRERWAIFAAYNLTDPTIRASLVAWTQQRNTLTPGARCFLIVGGALGEDLSTANARSQAINDFNIINLGQGTLHYTDEDRDLSTAEFVARYAGARAWRGENRDDIYVRFADVDVIAGPSLTEQAAALLGGTVVFSRDTAIVPCFIREAVTTYTDDTASTLDSDGNKTHPVALYKRIKDVAIQHAIELELGEWARSGDILGDMPVDDKTRQLVLGKVRTSYQSRELARVVQPGWSVALDGPVSDDDDFVALRHGFHPTRSLRQMFNVARIG